MLNRTFSSLMWFYYLFKQEDKEMLNRTFSGLMWIYLSVNNEYE